MNSLSSHLTAGRHHGRLRFHPDCPICHSQRLSGPLCDTVLSARAQAVLLATTLGAGALLPTSVAAASDDSEPPAVEVSQAPVPAPEPKPPPALEEPSLGADETLETPVDEAPQVRELLTSPEAGTDTGGEDIGGEDEDVGPMPSAPLGPLPVEPAPVEPAPVEPQPVEPPPVMVPSPPTPAPQPPPPPVEAPPAAELRQPTTRQTPNPPTNRQAPKRKAQPPKPERRLASELGPVPATAAPPAEAVAASTATVPVAQPVEPPGGAVTGTSYMVRPGDSLWALARRLLGGSPSAGQIAREVDRLWRLNAERIGTDNPSLIHVGTVLRLR